MFSTALSTLKNSIRNPKIFLPILLGVVLATIGVVFVNVSNNSSGASENFLNSPISQTDVAVSAAPTTSPTPFPFQEMTIPYLRNQTYESTLELGQRIRQNSNYSSYISSYTSDGLKLNGLLTVPTGEAPEGGWPAVIFLHGYIPPTLYKTTENYASYIDFFARNGFVVYKIDLRGHDQSEGEAHGAYYSGDYIVDTLNAYSALQRSDLVNPEKIGLWGHSMAGNVVMRTAAAKTDIPAVVIWAGAVYTYDDMREYGINDNSYRPPSQTSERRERRERLREVHGDFDADHPFWKQVAVTEYLSDIKGSVQIHHAVNDSVVPIGYSRNLSQLLESNGVNYELFEYASGGHNLSGGAFNQAMQRSLEFYRSTL